MTHTHGQKLEWLQTELKNKRAQSPPGKVRRRTTCGWWNPTSSLNASKSRNSNGALHVEH